VAFVAHVDWQSFAESRTGFELVATAAGNSDDWVIRVDISFHGVFLS
jgi:hypothetical protein